MTIRLDHHDRPRCSECGEFVVPTGDTRETGSVLLACPGGHGAGWFGL